MIVVDGNDGTGKSTLVAALDALGFEVRDRGLPTKATDEGVPETVPDDDLYLILDAPEETCRTRLEAAGKDMDEHWHRPETLAHYRTRFREVAAAFGVELLDSSGTPEETLAKALERIGCPAPPVRVGIPKGRLFDGIERTMREAGFPMEVAPRNYHPKCDGLRPFILKPRSIPQMVALGLLDAGFCGRDLVEESGYDDRIEVAADLGTNPVRLMAAAPDPSILDAPPSRPLVIATEFPHIADRWASARNLAHISINTWGSTEAWAPTYADLVLDVVETGETMAANGLTILEEVLRSTTVLIVRSGKPCAARHTKLAAALRRSADD